MSLKLSAWEAPRHLNASVARPQEEDEMPQDGGACRPAGDVTLSISNSEGWLIPAGAWPEGGASAGRSMKYTTMESCAGKGTLNRSLRRGEGVFSVQDNAEKVQTELIYGHDCAR